MRATGTIAAVIAAITAVAGGMGAGALGAAPAKTLMIRVDAKDFSFALSRRSVSAGTTVRFVVSNRGNVPHDFVLGNSRTRVLGPKRTQTITVRFPKRGTFRFLCSVPGHATLGMRGTFAVGRPAAPARPPAPPPPQVDVSSLVALTEIARLERPVHVTAPPGDTRRVFVVEQPGVIRVLLDGVLLPQPFLDIHDRVKVVSETGLLSLAFAPDYAASGRFYVFYNERKGNGDIAIDELRANRANRNVADLSTRRNVLSIVKPWENHNGGMLQFGPDGMLYVSVGDGDSGVLNRPGAFAQTRDELLGNLLRIDPLGGVPYRVPDDNPFVGEAGARPEVWAYGLRNPWRFWIDDVTGDTYIADVGLGRREEIDLVPRGESGRNFGWPCFEGTLPFDASATCADPVPPLLEVPHEAGVCSITGGGVVRDRRLPALTGRYLFADYCTGRVTAIAVTDGRVTDEDDLGLTVPQLASFGVDGVGRVYVVSTAGGVYRLDPKTG